MTLTLRNNPFTLYDPPILPDNLKRKSYSSNHIFFDAFRTSRFDASNDIGAVSICA